MASNRIKGITIEIEGNTTKLTDSLKSVDKSLKNTESELKDVNRLLKLDPNNTQLLQQKQELLAKAVEDTKSKLEQEKQALEQLKNADNSSETLDQQRALEREITETTQSLKGYESELAKSNVTLTQVGNTAQAVADKTRALSMAALGFGTALVGNAYKSAQAADDLNTLSKQTGFTVEELQKMQYASDLVDVSMDTMTGSIRKVVQNMSSGSDAFEQLGVNIYNADGSMRSATDVWYDSLDALSKVQNETERDALSMQIFGKSAMDMAGIVDDGGAALRSAGEEAEELGLILDQDALTSANEFNDAIDKLKATATASFRKAGTTLATALVPALEKLASVVTKVVTWFGNLTKSQQKTILVVVGLVAAISPVASIIATIVQVIGTLKTALTALNLAMSASSGPIGLIIAGITALIAIGVLLYKNWDTIKAKAIELWNKLVEVFNNIKTAISDRVTSIKNAVSEKFTAIRDAMTEKMTSAREKVASAVENIKSAISDRFNAVKSTVQQIFSDVLYAMTHPFETAKTLISTAIDKIKSFFNFEWELPKIKLPHFSVTGGVAPYGLGGYGSLPKLSIDWYAKAMRNGMILNSPTIFGAMGGQLLGGGEAGSETVVGTNSLMNMIQSAVGNAPTINMVVNANGMSADELSSIVVDKITTQIKRNNQRW